MIRVVLDTNIIVSGLLSPLGAPAGILLLALGGSIELCVSGDVYAEYEEVICRPRFRLSANVIDATPEFIREKAFWVRVTEKLVACHDPDDDVFLECAQAAKAQYPGDRKSSTLPGRMEIRGWSLRDGSWRTS